MSSSPANILRYSSLAFGALYGLSHQSSLLAQAKIAEVDRAYHDQENLIAKAKAEWTKKTMPAEKKTEGGGLIEDPLDPKFDLEAFLTVKMGETAR